MIINSYCEKMFLLSFAACARHKNDRLIICSSVGRKIVLVDQTRCKTSTSFRTFVYSLLIIKRQLFVHPIQYRHAWKMNVIGFALACVFPRQCGLPKSVTRVINTASRGQPPRFQNTKYIDIICVHIIPTDFYRKKARTFFLFLKH